MPYSRRCGQKAEEICSPGGRAVSFGQFASGCVDVGVLGFEDLGVNAGVSPVLLRMLVVQTQIRPEGVIIV
jgi:hypothetical protein